MDGGGWEEEVPGPNTGWKGLAGESAEGRERVCKAEPRGPSRTQREPVCYPFLHNCRDQVTGVMRGPFWVCKRKAFRTGPSVCRCTRSGITSWVGGNKGKTGDFSAPSSRRTPVNKETVVLTPHLEAQGPAVLRKNERSRRDTAGALLLPAGGLWSPGSAPLHASPLPTPL